MTLFVHVKEVIIIKKNINKENKMKIFDSNYDYDDMMMFMFNCSFNN